MADTLRNWDKLAEENPIHAAIAAPDEDAERRKSERNISVLVDKLSSGSVLDIGCGYGRIAKYLLPLRKFDRYIGLDGSAAMLEHFQQLYADRLKDYGTPIEFIQNSITNISLTENSVDNAIVSAVFLHNDKETTSRSILEIFRVLKPGGKLFIFASFPNVFNLQGLQGSAYLWFLQLRGRGAINGPVRYYSRAELDSLFQGFSNVEILCEGLVTLPKRILMFPSWLNRWYRIVVFSKLDQWLSKRLSSGLCKRLCACFDVYAVK